MNPSHGRVYPFLYDVFLSILMSRVDMIGVKLKEDDIQSYTTSDGRPE